MDWADCGVGSAVYSKMDHHPHDTWWGEVGQREATGRTHAGDTLVLAGRDGPANISYCSPVGGPAPTGDGRRKREDLLGGGGGDLYRGGPEATPLNHL